MANSRRRFAKRPGTTTVEAAFVLPVFFAFVFAIMQIGHASMIKHLLQHGCRAAARMGATEGVTTSDVEAKVREAVSGLLGGANVTVLVKNASVYDGNGDLPETSDDYSDLPNIEVSGAEPRQLFLVRAQVRYRDVALLPIPFTETLTITGQAFMRHE